jgi:RNA recognition motif-containing protein
MSEAPDPRNLIVNYIPTPVTDAELRQMFEQFGEVESARIITDRQTQQPKGYGFVKFKEESSARAAAEVMNGFEIYSKRLKVTTARGPQASQIQSYVQKVNNMQQQQQQQQQQQMVVIPPPYMYPPQQGSITSGLQQVQGGLQTLAMFSHHGGQHQMIPVQYMHHQQQQQQMPQFQHFVQVSGAESNLVSQPSLHLMSQNM